MVGYGGENYCGIHPQDKESWIIGGNIRRRWHEIAANVKRVAT